MLQVSPCALFAVSIAPANSAMKSSTQAFSVAETEEKLGSENPLQVEQIGKKRDKVQDTSFLMGVGLSWPGCWQSEWASG